jgi:hypothetical protein
MTFNEIRNKVVNFLRNSRNEDPSDVLNAYFSDIPKESCIGEAEELLVLLAEGTARPQARVDMINSGNPGVIAMRTSYAYPLLLTVLSWWVYAVYDTGTVAELTLEEKVALHKRLKDGIFRWDWQGYDKHRYDHLLDRLVPFEPQLQSNPPPGILRRIKLFFCGS